jgi:amino acid permease
MGGGGGAYGGYSWILQPFRVYAHHYYSGMNNLLAMMMSPAIVAMPFACYQGGYFWFITLLFTTALAAQQSMYFLAVSTEVRPGS